MAYMSERSGRKATIPYDAHAALREAERILAKTQGGNATFTYGERRFEGRYVKTELSRDHNGQGHAELAESLSAVLPVLDKLAADAAWGAYDHPGDTDSDEHMLMWTANRATLAALEAQGRQ